MRLLAALHRLFGCHGWSSTHVPPARPAPARVEDNPWHPDSTQALLFKLVGVISGGDMRDVSRKFQPEVGKGFGSPGHGKGGQRNATQFNTTTTGGPGHGQRGILGRPPARPR